MAGSHQDNNIDTDDMKQETKKKKTGVSSPEESNNWQTLGVSLRKNTHQILPFAQAAWKKRTCPVVKSILFQTNQGN